MLKYTHLCMHMYTYFFAILKYYIKYIEIPLNWYNV